MTTMKHEAMKAAVIAAASQKAQTTIYDLAKTLVNFVAMKSIAVAAFYEKPGPERLARAKTNLLAIIDRYASFVNAYRSVDTKTDRYGEVLVALNTDLNGLRNQVSEIEQLAKNPPTGAAARRYIEVNPGAIQIDFMQRLFLKNIQNSGVAKRVVKGA